MGLGAAPITNFNAKMVLAVVWQAVVTAALIQYSCETPVVAHQSFNRTHAWFSQLLLPSADAGSQSDGQRLLLDFSMGADGNPCPPPHGPPQNCTQSMESSDGGRSWSLLSNHWAPNAALPGAAGTDQIVTLGYRQTVDTLTNLSCSSTGQVVEIGNSSVGGSAVHVIRSFTTSFRVNRSVPGFENHTWPPVIVHSGPIVPASPAPTSADGGGSSWLTTMYGHGDGPYRHWSRRPTVYLVKSTDGGENWQLRSKIDWQPAFGNSSDGPGEPSMARLPSGRLLLVFRSDATAYFWKAFSDDEGEHWSPPAVMDKQGGQWSVRPQLRVLSNGLLVLSGGRPGIKLWVCADGAGESWQEIDIAREHNALVSAARPALLFTGKVTNVTSPFDGRAHPPATSSYTSIYEVFEPQPQQQQHTGQWEARATSTGTPGTGTPGSTPGTGTAGATSTIVVSYDRLANGWTGPPGPWGDADTMLTMRIVLTKPRI